jgi:hypothetical protein
MKAFYVSLAVFLIFSGMGSIIYAQKKKVLTLNELLPGEKAFSEWKEIDTPTAYSGDELYLMMDGNAALFMEYGFKKVLTTVYENNNNQSVEVELFQMGGNDGAYGVFTNTIDEGGKKVAFGDEGMLNDTHLTFKKSCYFVSLVASDNSKENIEGLMLIAKTIDQKIETSGNRPLLVESLYLKDFTPSSVTYIKGNQGLTNQYLFSQENIFGLREGIIGVYDAFKVFIFKYDSNNSAFRWFNNALENIGRSPKFSDYLDKQFYFCFKDKGEKKFTVRLHNNYILILQEKKDIDASFIFALFEKNLK